jgi:Lrp/AsnC family transcriptional regulator, regulator for asnA, asnC and gidA
MDEFDLKIMQKLMKNSRTPYREIADSLEIGVSAIHKRVKKMEEDNIIHAYIARPNWNALNYLIVTISGKANVKSLDQVSDEVGNHENTFSCVIASGKFFYATGYLRNITELQDYSSFVTQTTKMENPTIGIMNLEYCTPDYHLTTLDFKILKTLNRDARKPITDIAEEVGISAKTVRKRIDEMIEHRLVDFGVEWDLIGENNFMTDFRITLIEGTDIDSVIQHLYTKYSDNVIYITHYANVPNLVLFHVWCRSAQESSEIERNLLEEGYKDVLPVVFLRIPYYDNWLDQLVRAK